jgi:hypothetical protein
VFVISPTMLANTWCISILAAAALTLHGCDDEVDITAVVLALTTTTTTTTHGLQTYVPVILNVTCRFELVLVDGVAKDENKMASSGTPLTTSFEVGECKAPNNIKYNLANPGLLLYQYRYDNNVTFEAELLGNAAEVGLDSLFGDELVYQVLRDLTPDHPKKRFLQDSTTANFPETKVRLLILVWKYTDSDGEMLDVSYYEQAVWSGIKFPVQKIDAGFTGSVNGLFQEASYGKLSIPRDESKVAIVDMAKPTPTACPHHQEASYALQQVAEAQQIRHQDYDLVHHVIPMKMNCAFKGQAPVGCLYAGRCSMRFGRCVKRTCKSFAENGRWRPWPLIMAHELGHNFGLMHANYDTEYGDHSGIMGQPTGWTGYTAAHRFQLGWIPDDQVCAECTHTAFKLRPLSAPLPSQPDGTYAIGKFSIARSLFTSVDNFLPTDLIISYRTPIGYDTDLPQQYHYRVMVQVLSAWEKGNRNAGSGAKVVDSENDGLGVGEIFEYIEKNVQWYIKFDQREDDVATIAVCIPDLSAYRSAESPISFRDRLDIITSLCPTFRGLTLTTTTSTTAPPHIICDHTCKYDGDGVCDDGGIGTRYSSSTHCRPYGSDCTDCGLRLSDFSQIQGSSSSILTSSQQDQCGEIVRGKRQQLDGNTWCGTKTLNDCEKFFKLGTGGGVHPCVKYGAQCAAAPWFTCCAYFCKNIFSESNVVNWVQPNKWCSEFDGDEQECPKKLWRGKHGEYYMCVWDTNMSLPGSNKKVGCRLSLAKGCACKDSSR